MNKSEELLSYYDDRLKFVFYSNMPDGLPGLIIEDTIYLNQDLSHEELIATIAEEIGHYETSPTKEMTDYGDYGKSENDARKWRYKKLMPYDDLKNFIKNKETVYDYEIAEQFDVPKEIIEEDVNMYRIKGDL